MKVVLSKATISSDTWPLKSSSLLWSCSAQVVSRSQNNDKQEDRPRRRLRSNQEKWRVRQPGIKLKNWLEILEQK